MHNEKKENVIFLLPLTFIFLFVVSCTNYLQEYEDEYGNTQYNILNGAGDIALSSFFDDGSLYSSPNGFEYGLVSSSSNQGDSQNDLKSKSSDSNEKKYDCKINDEKCIQNKVKKSGTEIYLQDDRDGNVYKVFYLSEMVAGGVSGGSIPYEKPLLWMAENIRYVKSGNVAVNGDGETFYPYDMAVKVCPSGWELPTYEEWTNYKDAICDYNDICIQDESLFEEKGFYTQSGYEPDKSARYWAKKEKSVYWYVHSEPSAWYNSNHSASAYENYAYHVRCVKEFEIESEASSSSEKSSSSAKSSSSNKPCEGAGWNVLYEKGGTNNGLKDYSDGKGRTNYFFEKGQNQFQPMDMSVVDSLCVDYKTSNESAKFIEMGYYSQKDGTVFWRYQKIFENLTGSIKFNLDKFENCWQGSGDTNCDKNNLFERKINGFATHFDLQVNKITYKLKSGESDIEKSNEDFADILDTLSGEGCTTTGVCFKVETSQQYMSGDDEFKYKFGSPEDRYKQNPAMLGIKEKDVDVSFTDNGIIKIEKKASCKENCSAEFWLDDSYVFDFTAERNNEVCVDAVSSGPFDIELNGLNANGEDDSYGKSDERYAIYSAQHICANVSKFYSKAKSVRSIVVNFTESQTPETIYIKNIHTLENVKALSHQSSGN